MNAAKPLKERVTDYIGQSGLQLPMFNPIALELHNALKDEKLTTAGFEAVITRDPGLSGQVLRMANSSAFAGLTQIGTIKQAVLRLGMKQVARLAIAAAQLSLYRSANTLTGPYMGELWRQAYACARGAGWIAERIGRPGEADAAFLAGLLHDIGKLLILRALEEIVEKGTSGQTLSRALIDEMIEGLHCELGYALMKQWNLPEAYCIVSRDHHVEEPDAGRVLVAIVRVMDQVCAKIGIGAAADPEVVPAASPEAQALGLSEVQLAELEIELEDSMAPA